MYPVVFTIQKKLSGQLGRAGLLRTLRGDIETPAFLPVGTKATIKGIEARELRGLGVQGLIANTYHLYLQPGSELVASLGGLHSFMNWQGPIITDSGGFQVFSLGAAFGKGVTKFAQENEETDKRGINIYSQETATKHGKLCIVDEEGATFTSHIDGSLHRLTPERSIEIQHQLGADIIIAFDECTSPVADYEYQKEAMNRTHRWALQSLQAHRGNIEANKKQGLFAVVQGGRFSDLREESARLLSEMGLARDARERGGFDGFGIGGSFTKEDLGETLVAVNEILPEDKPRHMLGIGEPEDVFEAVENGCDTFDCVSPTRLGRMGTLYTKEGKKDITKSTFQNDKTLLSEISPVFEGDSYTIAYLHHLFRAKEMLGPILATMSNIHFLTELTHRIRVSIMEDHFDTLKEDFLNRYNT